MQTIVVISNQALWEEAQTAGEYTQSTVDSSLWDVGFIHCTNPAQTILIANRHFSGYDDLLLLLVDLHKVTSKVKFEQSLSARSGVYPHIYGPLNINAVYGTIALSRGDDGQFAVPIELQPLLAQPPV